ncbi:unnamed protein product [Protopolystoma xenopodis]|uniref:Uncharacterized protein n=1 Tax=Protopolystoma xenopodis TaxID=117903 RepID=A0A3S5AW64_9PLAT|nr:unnamed protein product [Protopolystoma xenopodis]
MNHGPEVVLYMSSGCCDRFPAATIYFYISCFFNQESPSQTKSQLPSLSSRSTRSWVSWYRRQTDWRAEARRERKSAHSQIALLREVADYASD